MGMTLAEMRFCFRGALLNWYREEKRRYEGYSVLGMMLGAKEDPFEFVQQEIDSVLTELAIADPKKAVSRSVINDATIRNQIRQAGIPFQQIKVNDDEHS